jgi:hypothetical protein
MASPIFPLNVLKVQRPPVLRMRTRADGALSVHPFDPESPVGARTETGMSTNTESGTAAYATSTSIDTATASDLSTQTATAVIVPGGEEVQHVVSSTVQRVNVKTGPRPDPSNVGFAVDPTQLETVIDETGNPVKDVSNVRISRVYSPEGPQTDATASDITIHSTSPLPGAGADRLFTANDADASAAGDDDHEYDIDNVDDEDDDEDTPQDTDSVAAEGVVLPFGDGGTFQPPLAPRGTRARRRK